MFEGNILLIMIRSHTIPNLCLVNVIGIPFHSYDTRRLSRRYTTSARKKVLQFVTSWKCFYSVVLMNMKRNIVSPIPKGRRLLRLYCKILIGFAVCFFLPTY